MHLKIITLFPLLTFTCASCLSNFVGSSSSSRNMPRNSCIDIENGKLTSKVVSTPTAFICPSSSSIAPCTCDQGTITLNCRGVNVTQDTIDVAAALVRQVNGVPDDVKMPLNSFVIAQTTLSQLDFSPFLGFFMGELALCSNPKMTKILPPTSNNGSTTTIQAIEFFINIAPLGDDGIGEILHHFEPMTMTYLSLANVQIIRPENSRIAKMNGLDTEFLPGLSQLTQLRQLDLGENRISSIGGGQFRKNSRLDAIFFHLNQMTHVGQDSFVFDDSAYNGSLTIVLQWNQLSMTNFHVQSGLEVMERPINLFMGGNNFETLTKAAFETFLYANEGTYMDIFDNPLVCDVELKWIKDAATILESRVLNSECGNDPGHSIFDSTLIP